MEKWHLWLVFKVELLNLILKALGTKTMYGCILLYDIFCMF